MGHSENRNSYSAFGEQLISELTPVEQLLGTYGLRDRVVTLERNAATADGANSEYRVQTGTNTAGEARIASRIPTTYRPGQGVRARFTARFTAGVANSEQIAGPHTSVNGFSFGYDGTSFGVLHRHTGIQEVQTMTITVAATGAESVTLTLDGRNFIIAVTNVSKEQNAYEIASGLMGLTTEWVCDPVGDTVIFTAESGGDKVGAFGIVSTGVLAGTFVETTTGVAKVDDWVALASWNKQPAHTIDPINGNVFEVSYPYLGYGDIKYYIQNKDTGRFDLVHIIKYANTNTTTSLTDPNMPIAIHAANTGNNTNLTVASGSMAAFVEGKLVETEPPRADGANVAGVTTALKGLVAIRVMTSLGGKRANVRNLLKMVKASTDSAKGALIDIRLNPDNMTTLPEFAYVAQNNSVMSVDKTGDWDFTTGRGLGSIVVGSLASAIEDFNPENVTLVPGDIVVVGGAVLSGAASAIAAEIQWQEEL